MSHDGLHDGPQSAGAQPVFHGLVNHVLDGVFVETQGDAVHLEEFAVLAHQRVFRFQEYAVQGSAVEGVEVCQHGQTADDFGDESEGFEVLGGDVLHQVAGVETGDVLHGVVTHRMGVEPLRYLPFDAVEGSAADEKDVGGVHLDVILVGVFASAFGGHVDHSAFEEFEKALLHTLAAYVAGDGGVVLFAGYLVYFVNEDDAALGAAHVVVGHLKQPGEDALDVLADVTGFSENGGVDNGEGDVDEAGYGACEQRLAGSRGSHHDEVGFFQLHTVVADSLSEAFVVVVYSYGKCFLGLVLADDILVEVSLYFFGTRHLGEVGKRLTLLLSSAAQGLFDNFMGLFGTVVADVTV